MVLLNSTKKNVEGTQNQKNSFYRLNWKRVKTWYIFQAYIKIKT